MHQNGRSFGNAQARAVDEAFALLSKEEFAGQDAVTATHAFQNDFVSLLWPLDDDVLAETAGAWLKSKSGGRGDKA